MSKLIPLLSMLLVVAAVVFAPGGASAVELGDILVTDQGASSVFIVDPSSGAQSVLTSGGYLSDPVAVAVNTTMDVFVVEGDRFGVGSKIVRVDAATGTQTQLSAGGKLLDPNDIAIQASGFLLIADFSGPWGLGGIIRIDPSTGAQQTFFSATSEDPFYLALEASGDIVFTNRNAFASTVYRLPSTGTTPTALNNDVGLAQGIAVESDGNILVVDAGAFGAPAHVFRVDPVSGDRTTVSTAGLLAYPTGIAIDSHGDIYVSQAGAIIRVDPATGDQTPVSSGGLFNDLQGLTFFGAAPDVVQLALDIKPGACPNQLNVLPYTKAKENGKKPHGVLPVALLGTSEFDVADVDVSTVRLEGVEPLGHAFDDVSEPTVEQGECACGEGEPDGYTDLTLKFSRAELVDALGSPSGAVSLTLTGQLVDGRDFEASDCVSIVDNLHDDGPTAYTEAPPPVVLEHATPSPFNPTTRISYTLREGGHVLLAVYDVRGTRVATLVDGEVTSGAHTVTWRADDLPSGVYFYRVDFGSYSETRKAILVK